LFNGEPPKLRSEQVSENNTPVDGPQGIPGAASNTPPGATAQATDPAADAAPAVAATTETSRSATRNFELDRTLQHTRQPAGRIRRVTAAVLVDHVPRTGKDGKSVLQPL